MRTSHEVGQASALNGLLLSDVFQQSKSLLLEDALEDFIWIARVAAVSIHADNVDLALSYAVVHVRSDAAVENSVSQVTKAERRKAYS
jgi:hypothetical protein